MKDFPIQDETTFIESVEASVKSLQTFSNNFVFRSERAETAKKVGKICSRLTYYAMPVRSIFMIEDLFDMFGNLTFDFVFLSCKLGLFDF